MRQGALAAIDDLERIVGIKNALAGSNFTAILDPFLVPDLPTLGGAIFSIESCDLRDDAHACLLMGRTFTQSKPKHVTIARGGQWEAFDTANRRRGRHV